MTPVLIVKTCQDEFTTTQLRTRSSIHSCWHRLKKLWRLPTYGVKLVRKRCRLGLGQGKWGFLEEGWDAFRNGFSTTCVLNDESFQLFEDVFGTSLDMNRSILVEDFSLHMFPEGAILNTHPSLEVKIKVCFRVCLTACHSFFDIYLHISFEQGFIFGVRATCVLSKRHNNNTMPHWSLLLSLHWSYSIIPPQERDKRNQGSPGWWN